MSLRFCLLALIAFAAPLHAAPSPAEGAPALWRVADEDTTIYLFGTIHVLPQGVDWYRGPVVAAFDAADEVVLETVEPEDDAQTAMTYMNRMMLPEGKSLRARLPAAYRNRFDTAIGRARLPMQMADRMKPWLAAFALGGANDPNTRRALGQLGVETILTTRARAAGKTLGEVEGAEVQFDLLDSVPSPIQIRFLQETLDSVATAPEGEGDALLDAWRSGDTAALETITGDWPREPEMRAVLLDRRNANWAKWVEDRLKRPGTVLLAVGAAHLVGGDSLQHHLAERNITVTRVQP